MHATAGNAAIADLLGPVTVQRARKRPRTASRIEGLLSDLLSKSAPDAAASVDEIEDEKTLRALLVAMSTREASADADEVARRLMLINHLALRQTQAAVHERVLALLARIMKPATGGLSDKDRADLTALLKVLSDQDLKEIEQDLVLWRTLEPVGRMADTIEVVTERARIQDVAGGAQSRFPLTAVEGGAEAEPDAAAVPDDVMDEADRFSHRPGNLCLNFVVEASKIVLAGESDRYQAAFSSYGTGAAERAKKTPRGARTLGRFASELRLQGLAGPVNVLRWIGPSETGHHEPSPAGLLTRLSGQGEGWYFFTVNQFSYHTFVVGVRVDPGGERTFYHIDDNGTDQLDADGLDNAFDRDLNPKHGRGVGSKVWQLYGEAEPAGS